MGYCVRVPAFLTLRQFQARETSQESSADDWISSEYWPNGLHRLASELGTLAEDDRRPMLAAVCKDIVLPGPGLYAFDSSEKITAGNEA